MPRLPLWRRPCAGSWAWASASPKTASARSWQAAGERLPARPVRAPLPVRSARSGRSAQPMRQVPGAGLVAPPQARPRRHQAPGAAAGGDEAPMTVSVPLVAVLGVVVYLAYRYMGLRVWQAVV